jgi:peptidyl-tRNA hydrolase, PTH1 family
MELSQASPVKLIVGLGNPGSRYQNTRHNVGFMVLDSLAKRSGINFRPNAKAQAEEGKLGLLTLIKPTTFMNLSGQAVQHYQTKLALKPADILLIHDDLDLPFGRMRFKAGGGGAGGQGGVSDTLSRIGPDFLRLKLGIGRPPEGWAVESWVLSQFAEAEWEALQQLVERAAEATEMLLQEGLEAAMNRYNRLAVKTEAGLEAQK